MEPRLGNSKYITLAGVVSALSVVILHTDGCYWTFSSTARYWKTANIIDAVFYFAVPVFFMMSASTLLDYNKRYDTKTFFKKRINKTVIPYIFWSLMIIVFNITVLRTLDVSSVSLSYIANALGNGSACGYYWFFPSLFSFYLSIPLFSLIPEDKRKSLFIYVSTVSFIVCSVIPFIISVFNFSFSVSLTIGVGSGYLFYLTTGYLISHYDMDAKVCKIIYVLGIIGLLVHIIGTYFVSIEAGEIVRTYKGYTNVPGILYSVAIFVFFKQYGNRIMNIKIIDRIVSFLSKYTFSIYLLQFFVIKTFTEILLINRYSIIYRLFGVIPITIIIVAVTMVIRKIPILKRLLP